MEGGEQSPGCPPRPHPLGSPQREQGPWGGSVVLGGRERGQLSCAWSALLSPEPWPKANKAELVALDVWGGGELRRGGRRGGEGGGQGGHRQHHHRGLRETHGPRAEHPMGWAEPQPWCQPRDPARHKARPWGGVSAGDWSPQTMGQGCPRQQWPQTPRTGLVQVSGQGGGSPAATSLDTQRPSRTLRPCWHMMGTEEGPAAAMATARSPSSLSHPSQEKASRVTRVGFGTTRMSPATGGGAAWEQGPRPRAPRHGHSTEEG